MDTSQRIIVVLTWIALLGASLYVPYYVPPDDTYSYSWIWEPVEYHDSFTRELAKQLDDEEPSEEFSIPAWWGTQRAKPTLWLFVCEVIAIAALGLIAFHWRSDGSLRNALTHLPKAQRLHVCLIAAGLLVFSLGYYTHRSPSWSDGESWEVIAHQHQLGLPLHWLTHTKLEFHGEHPGEQDPEAAIRTFPGADDHTPGISVGWIQFTVALLCLVPLTAITYLLAKRLIDELRPLSNRYVAVSLLVVTVCAVVAGLCIPIRPVWGIVIAVLGLPIPVVIVCLIADSYPLAVVSSLISILTFAWTYRVADLFREDHEIHNVGLENDVVAPVAAFGILLAVSFLAHASRKWIKRIARRKESEG